MPGDIPSPFPATLPLLFCPCVYPPPWRLLILLRTRQILGRPDFQKPSLFTRANCLTGTTPPGVQPPGHTCCSNTSACTNKHKQLLSHAPAHHTTHNTSCSVTTFSAQRQVCSMQRANALQQTSPVGADCWPMLQTPPRPSLLCCLHTYTHSPMCLVGSSLGAPPCVCNMQRAQQQRSHRLVLGPHQVLEVHVDRHLHMSRQAQQQCLRLQPCAWKVVQGLAVACQAACYRPPTP